MIAKSDLSMSGTSYHQINVLATLNELKALFGEPDSFDKSFYNFRCEIITIDADGDSMKEPFTLYDYKEVRPPQDEELFEWHIGTHEKSVAAKIKLEIEKSLEKIR
jgi:hypothetical protein